MRPVRTIAALLFAATVGMLTLLAAPAWAASTTSPVVIDVSPSPVVAGHTVTVSGSVGPDAAGSDCASIILYSNAFAPTNDVGSMTAVYATAKPAGTFTATTTISRSKAAGTYTIFLRCGGATLGSATLVVRAAASPTTMPAPAAPSATTPPVTQPPVAAPAVAGPATQPATTAAARPASRWIIPGLAALGSGTLAALGVWLLYRRRHPAGSSRQGRSRMAH